MNLQTKVYVLNFDHDQAAIRLPIGSRFFGIIACASALLVEYAGAVPALNDDPVQPSECNLDPEHAVEVAADDEDVPRQVALVSREVIDHEVIRIVQPDENPIGELTVVVETLNTPPEELECWPGGELEIIEGELPQLVDDAPMEFRVPTRGGVGPFTFEVDAAHGDMALPSGLSLDAATGVIDGTPDTPGPYDFQINVVDSSGTPLEAEMVYQGDVWAKQATLNETLDGATEDEPYEDDVEATDGQGVVVLEILAGGRGSGPGGLPEGLDFTDNEDGTATIDGTPTQVGEFPITVRATDSEGRVTTQMYVLTVAAEE